MADAGVTWRALLVIGAVYSTGAALLSYAFTRATGRSLWTLQADPSADLLYILAMNVALWGSWAAIAPLVFGLSRRYRFDRQGWRRAALVHVPMSVVVTAGHLAFVASARFVLQSQWGLDVRWTPLVTEAFFRTFDFELPIYWALVGCQHALDYYRERRQRDLDAAQLQTRLVEAQLLALQRQLHPHFLFNTLHAISALVHGAPDRADAMIERLSDLLRVTLDQVGVQEVTVAEELEYLRAYLDIQQVHFGERLEVVYRIDAHALAARVPNLILQPIVENAVRHGLEPRSARARLEIEALVDSETLRLRVADNGRGLPAGPIAGGVGLANTRARLAHLYGAAAALDLQPRLDGGVVVTLRVPYRASPPHEHPSPHRRRSAAGARAPRRLACG
jgi:signal transduction histidine kinase